MGNFLKKNWFVVLMAAAFLGMSCFYIYDTNKGKLKGKQADGLDVVYSIAGEDVTVSDFYDELYTSNGVTTLGNLLIREVADQTISTTNEMKETAKQQAENLISTYRSYYGTEYKDALKKAMISIGYESDEDVEKYMLNIQKQQALTENYARDHFEDLNIRSISYILIQFDDVPHTMEEATDEEKARIKSVDDAFAAGDDFRTVAINNSQDSSTASRGGILGTIDKNTANLDKAFLEAALSLEEGEVSDWVYSNSFGWFRIKCNASTPESLQAFADEQALFEARTAAEKAAAAAAGEGEEPEPVIEEDLVVAPANPFSSLISSYDTTLTTKAVWEKAHEIGLSSPNELLEGQLKGMLGLDEEEAE